MHPSTHELFSETMEKTDAWLRELMQAMGYSSPHQAYSLLRAVLHALRDRLTVDSAAKLGAQLPTLVRGFYYDGWHPASAPLKLRHKQEFLDLVVDSCQAESEEPEPAVRAALAVIGHHVSAGELRHILDQLPQDLKALWPS